jgi:hypothetical protein
MFCDFVPENFTLFVSFHFQIIGKVIERRDERNQEKGFLPNCSLRRLLLLKHASHSTTSIK